MHFNDKVVTAIVVLDDDMIERCFLWFNLWLHFYRSGGGKRGQWMRVIVHDNIDLTFGLFRRRHYTVG